MDAEKLVKAFSIDEQKELLAALPLDLIVNEVGVRGYEISKGVGTTAVDSITETSTALEASADVKSLLTQEQKQKTELYVDALAKTFNMSKADLGLVVEETPEGARRAVLIDTSPMGQYLGSYDSIQMNGKGWINVGGEEVNVLAGTTDAAYRAMIKDAKKNRPDQPLPDSSANEIWTATMLTGEPLTADGDVQFRDVGDGGVSRAVAPPDYDFRSLRVRPAVVIAELKI